MVIQISIANDCATLTYFVTLHTTTLIQKYNISQTTIINLNQLNKLIKAQLKIS